ncbi:MAG TPA: DUF6600 domain-containing protein [Thermodesulfovibrionales bacterium]|nr:DUF6600 domain-containing protein [Thermodesulfovibrionales bacterium]
MKITKAILIAAILFLFPSYLFSADLGYLRISFIQGDVQVKTPDAGDWGPASVNAPLMEGDQVWVPQGGKVELQLNTGTYVRLDENSAFQILSLDRNASQFYLSQGHAYILYDAPPGVVLQIDDPDASTRAFDKAIFRIDMSDQYQYTDVAVYKGYVETENQIGKTRVDAGQMVSLGQNSDGEVAPMGPPDSWESWNKKRNDRLLARRGESSRYLPAELRAYSYDFDSGGRWVDVPDYGYVWTPTVVVGADWAPYRLGTWIWRGGEYIWVSYDPWGWAPYHYGRWAFVARTGWCWVPPVASEVYWGPGFVGWVRTADYVAWVPLAPGETYYGRGYYGRNSVNVTNINVNQVNITNVYKNVYVNNGVTVVNRNTFATASPKVVRVNQNVVEQKIFVKNNISVGTPDIKPTRASYFASAKAIPQAKLPPQPVRNLQVQELKQSRPLTKEPTRSVMNRGAAPKTLPVNTASAPRSPGKGKPAIQQVQPAERARPGAPEGGVVPRGEKPQAQPTGRKPLPTKAAPQRSEKTQVQPKPSAPEGGVVPRGEKPQAQPAERKPVQPPPQAVPPPRGERPQAQPAERKPVQQPPQVQPAEKRPTPPPQIQPEERRPVPPVENPQKGQKQERPEEPPR